MNPVSSSSSSLEASSQAWTMEVLVGGLFFLGAWVILLLHCASSSGRKKRQRIEDGAPTNLQHTNGSDVIAQNRKWRESQKKQSRMKTKGRRAVGGEFPQITIIVTPPSPRPEIRSLADDDAASIGSSGDLAAAEQNATSDNVITPGDVDGHDVTREDHDVKRSVSGPEGKSTMVCSTRSLSGIGDVNFVTSEEGPSERGEELAEGDCEPRPRLPSMEPGTTKADYRIIVVDNCKEIMS